ncbi:Spore protein SP21 [Fundidesulfovibrio magnetotacticus]|uniref:Spore protein SP21 n=1 Tax=Fundidesulfovibrio magnetotacticus TaxID=2730080 RepID=A0A6V8LV88_9BACT|nr:Hsp20/alpha crystallin family protein [Fundidesulfovibrio magnetotacticus]GFK93587.1 Spore protein SP21 [Fundidesulfovibrio magnetotacticus]
MSENQRNEERGLPRVKPATDIVETEDGFYIYMDMPGVSKEALVIDLNEDEIKVSGRTAYPASEAEEKLIHVEFGNGEYYRGFTLSHIVDKHRINAVLKNGVLELHLPKAEKAQPRKIEIQMG